MSSLGVTDFYCGLSDWVETSFCEDNIEPISKAKTEPKWVH